MHYIDIEDQAQASASTLYELNTQIHRSIIKSPKESEDDLSSCFGELERGIILERKVGTRRLERYGLIIQLGRGTYILNVEPTC
jgi:hypothetical protein